jgi:hypothetical protein
LSDISSSLMDVLRYNAGASSANPALPRVLYVEQDSASLKCGTIPSGEVSPRHDQEGSHIVPTW